MKTIKGLTDNQNTIILNIVSEFLSTNKSAECVSPNVIDNVFKLADKDVKEETEFYKNIELHNNRIKNQAINLIDAYVKKLKVLFKNYPFILVEADNTSICVGEKIENNIRLNGNFYISVTFYLERNPFDESSGFSFCNIKGKKRISKYSRFEIQIDKTNLNLDDFEHNSVFQDKVQNMFSKSLERGTCYPL